MGLTRPISPVACRRCLVIEVDASRIDVRLSEAAFLSIFQVYLDSNTICINLFMQSVFFHTEKAVDVNMDESLHLFT